MSAWVAVLIFLTMSQGTVVVSDESAYRTKAECEDINVRVIALARTKELWQDVLAYGTTCTEVTVAEVPKPVPGSVVVPPSKRKETI